MKIIKNELNVIKTTELYTKTELKRTKINKTSDVSSSQDCVELIVRELDENHKIASEIWHPPVEGTVVYPHYLQFFFTSKPWLFGNSEPSTVAPETPWLEDE